MFGRGGAVLVLVLAMASAMVATTWWMASGGTPAPPASGEPVHETLLPAPRPATRPASEPARAQVLPAPIREADPTARSQPRIFEESLLAGIASLSSRKSFDPIAFRAIAERLLELGEEQALARVRELDHENRRGEHTSELAVLIAFLWSGDTASMPHYMLVDGGDQILPAIRQVFPRFPILEEDGIPFFLDDLAFRLSQKPGGRRAGSYGRSGAGFVDWAGASSLRASLPPPAGDPLQAANRLAAKVQALVHAYDTFGGPESLVDYLRMQAWNCLGPRARFEAVLQGSSPMQITSIQWGEESWSRLCNWLKRQPAGWDDTGYYELEAP